MSATFIVGQQAAGTVTFDDGGGNLYDPPKVVLSSVSPFGTTTAYGSGSAVARVSQGVYQLTFTPSVKGAWVVVGDAFDDNGNQIGAGISDELQVDPRRGGDRFDWAAQAMVEMYIGRPIALVQNETVRLYSGEDGILQLPRIPVVSVASVTASIFVWEDQAPTVPVVPTPTATAAGLMSDPGLNGFTWYDVVYSHGWADPDVPEVIVSVMAAVSARLRANPDGVSEESIGAGFHTTYGDAGFLALTPDEERALAQFRPNRLGTLSTATPIGGIDQ